MFFLLTHLSIIGQVAYNTAKINKIEVNQKQDHMPGTHYYMKTLTESHYCTHTAQVRYSQITVLF